MSVSSRTTVCVALVTLSVLAADGVLAQDSELPDAYQQILSRGDIPAIFDPLFIPADEAEIRPEAWILGVVIEGQARAFSLNVLNRFEVVNDRIGETAYAAVW